MNYSRSFDTQLSKRLAWLLRHGAVKEGLPIASDGFISVESVLDHTTFRGRYTFEDIKRVVESDSKNRYTLTICPKTKIMLIKANQGHSMNNVSELNLKKIQSASEIPLVVHGTFFKHLQSIRRQGLKRMNRNHIHFAVSDKLITGKKRISGIRHNCEVLIYINTKLAIQSGIEFFRSENNVILSPGINGLIKSEFFLKVINRKTGNSIEA